MLSGRDIFVNANEILTRTQNSFAPVLSHNREDFMRNSVHVCICPYTVDCQVFKDSRRYDSIDRFGVGLS